MSDVKRYEPFGRDGLSSVMHEDDVGDYVRHDDYEAKRKGWIDQHARDSAELRRLCEERDQLRAELEAIRGQQPDTWPTLDKPAKVGPVRFNPGLSARLVVEAAQRQHEYSQQPEVEAARLERFGAFMREVHGENGDGGASDGP
ncbi:hypothetical protein [Metapseudomonas otitidis]|uniref:hypothetical protein n=1 Tax=Metapseudomonas otitidis TaxID=319939 RepID=UPI001AAEF784|nr:hypothetical protein [Pseudomonas otitidis]MBO2926697.1 hypothetical protein [Pseudomonas otitidis]